jgi:DNA-binding transcriptional MerR regulator
MTIDGPVSIGELAKTASTKVVTIRYYERIGLLPTPPRTSGNYRAYEREHVFQLRFIRRCRDLGFTLDQIRDLLRMSSRKEQVHGSGSSCRCASRIGREQDRGPQTAGCRTPPPQQVLRGWRSHRRLPHHRGPLSLSRAYRGIMTFPLGAQNA